MTEENGEEQSRRSAFPKALLSEINQDVASQYRVEQQRLIRAIELSMMLIMFVIFIWISLFRDLGYNLFMFGAGTLLLLIEGQLRLTTLAQARHQQAIQQLATVVHRMWQTHDIAERRAAVEKVSK